MQKVKEPDSGTSPTATPATPSTKVPVAPKVQGDVKKMMSVRSAINDAPNRGGGGVYNTLHCMPLLDGCLQTQAAMTLEKG